VQAGRQAGSTVLAAPEQAIRETTLKKDFEEFSSKWLLNKQQRGGNTDHLTSGCHNLGKKEDFMRHERVGALGTLSTRQ